MRGITQQWRTCSVCTRPWVPEKKKSGLESIGLIFNLNPRIGGDRISSEPRKPTLRAGLDGSQGEAGAGPGWRDRAELREPCTRAEENRPGSSQR